MKYDKYLQLRKDGVRDMHNTELLKACKEDNDLLEIFLQENRDFIFSIIIKYKGNIEEIKSKFNLDEEELLQHAYIGVISALRDFDFDRGIKFTTYVVRPIVWEINQLLYNDSYLIRLSRGAIDLVKKITEIENTLGYLPTDDELSQILKVPVSRIREVIRFTKEPDQINELDNIVQNDPMRYSEDDIINKIYVENLLENASLNEFEREIIDLIMRGLNNSQISERLGVYPMTINRAIVRIRNKMLNLSFDDRRLSKYEKEIKLVAEEMKELGSVIDIETMLDLLEVCGFDSEDYSPRILYYIRQKALQRVDIELEEKETSDGT